jgi:hypothetical protein
MNTIHTAKGTCTGCGEVLRMVTVHSPIPEQSAMWLTCSNGECDNYAKRTPKVALSDIIKTMATNATFADATEIEGEGTQ